MARPQKTGLDYFPFDIDFFQDEKIVALTGEFGINGQIAALRLLCEIYRNGYFMVWNKLVSFKMLSILPGITSDELAAIVGRLAEWGFFNAGLYRDHGVLTSAAIQKRYFEIVKKRRLKGDLPYLLVELPRQELRSGCGGGFRDGIVAEERAAEVSAELTPVSAESIPQIKGKEIKSNEIKITPRSDSKDAGGIKAAPFDPPAIGEVEDFIREEKLEVDAARFYNYHASKGWMVGNSPMVSWRAAVRAWHARGADRALRQPLPQEGVRCGFRQVAKSDMQLLAESEARHARERAAEAACAPAVKPSDWKRRRGMACDAPLTEVLLPDGGR